MRDSAWLAGAAQVAPEWWWLEGSEAKAHLTGTTMDIFLPAELAIGRHVLFTMVYCVDCERNGDDLEHSTRPHEMDAWASMAVASGVVATIDPDWTINPAGRPHSLRWRVSFSDFEALDEPLTEALRPCTHEQHFLMPGNPCHGNVRKPFEILAPGEMKS